MLVIEGGIREATGTLMLTMQRINGKKDLRIAEFEEKASAALADDSLWP